MVSCMLLGRWIVVGLGVKDYYALLPDSIKAIHFLLVVNVTNYLGLVNGSRVLFGFAC